MTTYRLTQQPTEVGLPIRHTIAAACIHTDDDFVRFHDANHRPVYAVQRGLLLAIETDEDEDQAAAEPEQPGQVAVGIKLDGQNIFAAAQSMQALRDDCLRGVGEYMNGLRTAIHRQAAAATRARCAEQYGWTEEQAAEVPDWLVQDLVDHLC